jgi:hypothetical protein
VPLDRVRLIAAKSSLGRHRKLCLARAQGSAPVSASEDGLRLARPQGSDSTTTQKTTESVSPDPRARTQPQLRKMDFASPDPRARTQPRLRKMDSASPDPRARTQPRPRKTVSASPDPGLGFDLDLGRQTRPRPRRSLRLARPRARTDHVTGGAIITLPLVSSGYGEQDRRPIWLAPVNK